MKRREGLDEPKHVRRVESTIVGVLEGAGQILIIGSHGPTSITRWIVEYDVGVGFGVAIG